MKAISGDEINSQQSFGGALRVQAGRKALRRKEFALGLKDLQAACERRTLYVDDVASKSQHSSTTSGTGEAVLDF